MISLFFYLNVKGLPPSKAPGDAPEGLHCFQQRKVSPTEAASETLAFDRHGVWATLANAAGGALGAH